MIEDQHIASVFDRDLEAIQAQIMKMGGLVEAAIRDSALSLDTRDEELAEQVRNSDKAIDSLEESSRETHDLLNLVKMTLTSPPKCKTM